MNIFQIHLYKYCFPIFIQINLGPQNHTLNDTQDFGGSYLFLLFNRMQKKTMFMNIIQIVYYLAKLYLTVPEVRNKHHLRSKETLM